MSNGHGPPSQRDRRSLQELAKLASSPSLSPASSRLSPPSSKPSTPPPPAVRNHEQDSGIVDLGSMAQVDPAAEERAKTTPLASAPLFDDETPSVPPPPSHSKPTPSSPASAKPAPSNKELTPPSTTRPTTSTKPPAQGKSSPAIPVAAGLVLAAVAAMGFALTRPPRVTPQASTATSPATTAAAPTPPAPAAAQPASPPAQAAGGDSPTPAVASDPTPAPVEAEPTRPAGGGGVSVPAGHRGGGKRGPVVEGNGGTAVSGLAAMMAQATNSTTTPPVTPTGPASNAALGEAVQHAVGGGAAAPAAADPVAPEAPHYAPGSVPQKPSQGAVTGALTRVLPAARSCLNPDDPLSRANVTFISGGTVSSVVITGGAAGKPAEECIRRALMKANVPPFAQDTYAANINVRPN